MKAEISHNGDLTITAESNNDAALLKLWVDNNFRHGNMPAVINQGIYQDPPYLVITPDTES